jgi:hypothetical protein
MALKPREVIAKFPDHFPGWFAVYLRQNQHVYVEIERLALQATRRLNHYGIDMLVGTIRWSSATSEVGTEYKISNEAAAYFARVFHFQHPAHRIFRMKQTRCERANNVQPPQ